MPACQNARMRSCIVCTRVGMVACCVHMFLHTWHSLAGCALPPFHYVIILGLELKAVCQNRRAKVEMTYQHAPNSSIVPKCTGLFKMVLANESKTHESFPKSGAGSRAHIVSQFVSFTAQKRELWSKEVDFESNLLVHVVKVVL